MRNNHPLLGICCHHRLHPLRLGQRCVILIGSIAFGLAATNTVYLYYIYKDTDMNEALLRIYLEGGNHLNRGDLKQFEITYGMISLWTFGGILHSLFDVCQWYLTACACCLPTGCFRKCSRASQWHKSGSYIVLAITAMLLSFATFVVVLRATYDNELRIMNEEEESNIMEAIRTNVTETTQTMANSTTTSNGISAAEFSENRIDWNLLSRIQMFSFMIGYFIELGLVYFLYYPLIGTALFSGVLGCGMLPFIGKFSLFIREIVFIHQYYIMKMYGYVKSIIMLEVLVVTTLSLRME